MGLDDAAALREVVRDACDANNTRADQGEVSPVLTWRGCEQRNLVQSFPGYRERVVALAPAPAVLREQVARLIRSEERHGTERYRSAGRLDRRALSRSAIDATNVFQRRTYVPGVDTAVLMLLDCSSSMGYEADPRLNGAGPTRMEFAKVLAVHLCEAAEAERGKVALFSFTGRSETATLHRVKDFDEAFDAGRLANVRPTQGTPLAVAMLGAAERLAAVTATRRILLVLTDGADDLGEACMKASIKMVEAQGIECAAIGCAFSVRDVFPVSVDVMNLAHLARDGLGALVALLDPDRDA